jgi:hypothetical protein
MAVNKTIPRKDADFNVWQDIIAKEAVTKTQTWLLDSTWISGTLTPARNKWNTAWTAYENPATRTTLITAAKQDARDEYEKVLMILVANLRSNTRLTDDDRRAVGIHIRDTKPTPAPVPTTFPVLAIDTSTARRLTINFRDSASTSAAKPKGVHGAEIKWLVADEKPTVEQLTNSTFDTRTPYTLIFTDDQRGKIVWICARWENTRGEKGPWGDMESGIIT